MQKMSLILIIMIYSFLIQWSKNVPKSNQIRIFMQKTVSLLIKIRFSIFFCNQNLTVKAGVTLMIFI
jgi:hypothetical protein